MAEAHIHLKSQHGNFSLVCKPGQTILEALGADHRRGIETPCGGKGTCGKCLVKVEGAGISPVSETERKKLSSSELGAGFRLACIAKVTGELTVTLAGKADEVVILEESIEFSDRLYPCVEKSFGTLQVPTLEDQRDDITRMREHFNLTDHEVSFAVTAALPDVMRNSNCAVTAVYNEKELIAVEPGDNTAVNYGLAVDIGTTTVVVYLLDLTTGKKIGTASDLNVQKAYGQDVISRINHAITNEDGLEILHRGIIDQLGELIDRIVDTHDIDKTNIYSMTVAGNTTMMHLAAGIQPKNIAAAPFIPAFLELTRVTAADLGLNLPPAAQIYLLPGISAYIGADITAATLASGMAALPETSLLIDIGTNGEIMFGNKDRLLSCSTAAGPAFEGASIHDGVGGITGAIDTVGYTEGNVTITTIGGAKPIGICGSGIVDAISVFIYLGLIDSTGRILPLDEIESEEGKALADKITEYDGQLAIILAPASESETGEAIILTQKDVREIQNAKASIAAGIKTLIKTAEKSMDEIETVYLAGGFGSYIDKHHAVHLGLIPKELEHKITGIGNAAGSGAIISLLSKEKMRECSSIAERTEYVELSSSPAFMDEYINSMVFE